MIPEGLTTIQTPSGRYGISCPDCGDTVYGPRRWHGGRLIGSRASGGKIEGASVILAALQAYQAHRVEEAHDA